jgi:hypothetical protein
MRYTIIPTRLSPLYRVEMPWDEYLMVHHVLRARSQHQLMGFLNRQMRQTGDGNAHLHLQHAEFQVVAAIVEQSREPSRVVQSRAVANGQPARSGFWHKRELKQSTPPRLIDAKR